jgi:hypothetical protein
MIKEKLWHNTEINCISLLLYPSEYFVIILHVMKKTLRFITTSLYECVDKMGCNIINQKKSVSQCRAV